MQGSHKRKPVIILKSGVSAAGAKAASSHTGALAGSDTAYETAFKHAGVLRASTMTELFDLASAFTTQPIPKGKRVAVITNSGGPGIVASDSIELGGMQMAEFSENTLDFLKETMPSMANIHNPIDVIGALTTVPKRSQYGRSMSMPHGYLRCHRSNRGGHSFKETSIRQTCDCLHRWFAVESRNYLSETVCPTLS